MNFRENLKKYRELAGYDSAAKFAEAVGIRYPTYIAYENRDREPKYEILCKIADALNVSTDQLLGHEVKTSIYEKKYNELLARVEKATALLYGGELHEPAR